MTPPPPVTPAAETESAVQRQTAVTAYLKSKQLLPFASALYRL